MRINGYTFHNKPKQFHNLTPIFPVLAGILTPKFPISTGSEVHQNQAIYAFIELQTSFPSPTQPTQPPQIHVVLGGGRFWDPHL